MVRNSCTDPNLFFKWTTRPPKNVVLCIYITAHHPSYLLSKCEVSAGNEQWTLASFLHLSPQYLLGISYKWSNLLHCLIILIPSYPLNEMQLSKCRPQWWWLRSYEFVRCRRPQKCVGYFVLATGKITSGSQYKGKNYHWLKWREWCGSVFRGKGRKQFIPWCAGAPLAIPADCWVRLTNTTNMRQISPGGNWLNCTNKYIGELCEHGVAGRGQQATNITITQCSSQVTE